MSPACPRSAAEPGPGGGVLGSRCTGVKGNCWEDFRTAGRRGPAHRLAAAGVPIIREPAAEPWGSIEMWIEDPMASGSSWSRSRRSPSPPHPLRRDSRSALPVGAENLCHLGRCPTERGRFGKALGVGRGGLGSGRASTLLARVVAPAWPRTDGQATVASSPGSSPRGRTRGRARSWSGGLRRSRSARRGSRRACGR
jgi:hypothetical protein